VTIVIHKASRITWYKRRSQEGCEAGVGYLWWNFERGEVIKQKTIGYKREGRDEPIPQLNHPKCPNDQKLHHQPHPSCGPLSSYASSEERTPVHPKATPKSNKICSDICIRRTSTPNPGWGKSKPKLLTGHQLRRLSKLQQHQQIA